MKDWIAVELECGDWSRIPVLNHASRSYGFCKFHHALMGQRIVTKKLYEWRVKCPPPCKFGRWCGQDEQEAKRRRTAHMASRPGHFTAVAYDKVTPDGKGTVLVWRDGLNMQPRRRHSWANPDASEKNRPRTVAGPPPF